MNPTDRKNIVALAVAQATAAAENHWRDRVTGSEFERFVYLSTVHTAIARLKVLTDGLTEESDYETAEALVDLLNEWFTAHPLYASLKETTRDSIRKAIERYREMMKALRDIRDGKSPEYPDWVLEEVILPHIVQHLMTKQTKPEPPK